MGLDQGRYIVFADAFGRVRDWWLAAAIICASLLAQGGGQVLRQMLRFDRAAIAEGELWRLLTGHFVHLGWPHAAMNIGGLILVWLLLGPLFSALQWCTVSVASIAAIDLGFWVLDTDLEWYVGLSGLLHGMLAAGALQGISRSATESWFIIIFLLAKLGYEQLVGPLPGSEASAGGTVIVNAHLYGAAGGAAAALLLRRSAGRTASI